MFKIRNIWWYGVFFMTCFWIYIYSTIEYHEPRIKERTKPVYFVDDIFFGKVHNKVEMKKKFRGYADYGFNVLVSDRIGYHRDVPDTRNEKCPSPKVLKKPLRCSVIITHHNEAVSTLLRTVASVLQRTPIELLHEIILIDDFSSKTDLEEINEYLDSSQANVKVIKAKKREGLIRGRMIGAREAKGDVLVFLDSHCEVNTQWLEPLVERIALNRKIVACPVIDLLNPHTFLYSASPIVRGGFNWALSFTWEEIPDSDDGNWKVDPFRSPTMAGGLFAIDRKYFFELGGYDEGMETWGGENLEISFKIWMCGGRLEIVPCSRVGHVFRSRSPLTVEENHDVENAVRVAEVWLDDFKSHFYDVRPGARKYRPDVSKRKQLRSKLKCENFDWFLHVVYSEMEIPGKRKGTAWRNHHSIDDTIVNFLSKGEIINIGTKLCLDVKGNEKLTKSTVIQAKCHIGPKKLWIYLDNDEIRLKRTDRKYCLDMELTHRNDKEIRVMKCHGEKAGQEWKYLKNERQLYNPASGLCLMGSPNDLAVHTAICDEHSLNQRWRIEGLG